MDSYHPPRALSFIMAAHKLKPPPLSAQNETLSLLSWTVNRSAPCIGGGLHLRLPRLFAQTVKTKAVGAPAQCRKALTYYLLTIYTQTHWPLFLESWRFVTSSMFALIQPIIPTKYLWVASFCSFHIAWHSFLAPTLNQVCLHSWHQLMHFSDFSLKP